jgi:hypothetical protein
MEPGRMKKHGFVNASSSLSKLLITRGFGCKRSRLRSLIQIEPQAVKNSVMSVSGRLSDELTTSMYTSSQYVSHSAPHCFSLKTLVEKQRVNLLEQIIFPKWSLLRENLSKRYLTEILALTLLCFDLKSLDEI